MFGFFYILRKKECFFTTKLCCVGFELLNVFLFFFFTIENGIKGERKREEEW